MLSISRLHLAIVWITTDVPIMPLTDEISTLYLTACAGRSIKSEATQCPPPSIMILQSITVFASTDSTAIEGAGQGCLQISQCKRVIHSKCPD